MMGSVNSIESFSTIDGPGIRTVVFLNDCHLRCIYCHNPEMWCKGKYNMSSDELVKKILNNKEYFGKNGGVTFSGGEPLLQADFIIEVAKKLKEYNINIALDTAGVGLGNYDELLKYIDLIIFDVKHITKEGYKNITRSNTDESYNFLSAANKLNKDFWIRQVIVPNINDSIDYIKSLKKFIKEKINNVKQIEFIPFHKLGIEKYKSLKIPYILKNTNEMDKEKCKKLYNKFMELYNNVK